MASISNSVWLTHFEAARYLGVSTSTLYRYAEQERIECRKTGNRLEYRRSTLDRFKENQIRPARRSRPRGIIAPTLGSGN
jgi:excisionase family DNA binding protein